MSKGVSDITCPTLTCSFMPGPQTSIFPIPADNHSILPVPGPKSPESVLLLHSLTFCPPVNSVAPFQYKPRILSLLNTPLQAPVLPSSSLGCLPQPQELPSSPHPLTPPSGSILNTAARVILSKYKLDQVLPLLNALQRPPSHWGKAEVHPCPGGVGGWGSVSPLGLIGHLPLGSLSSVPLALWLLLGTASLLLP